MTAVLVVIENETIRARAVIDTDALPTHEARGWVAVGETTDRNRDPIRSDVEHIADVAALTARIAALAAPKSGDATSPRPSK